ncbi:MAG: DUF2007 domain-containing protein [Salinimicrobium sp.]
MNGSNTYVDFYSGSEIELLRIQDLLESENISSIIQNDHQSGNIGGFFGGTPSTVRLKVKQEDFEKARTLIESQG